MRRLLIFLLVGVSPALAGDRGDWFASLKQNGSGISCCDVSDCHATEAEWRRNHWYAVVSEKWTPVPPESVLQTPRSLDGEAYVCNSAETPSSPAFIYCFIPPLLGY